MGTIVLYCQPGARQTQCVGLHDGLPKIQLQAAPVDGQANRALVAYIAQRCQVPKSAVSLEKGASARTKRVAVLGWSDGALQALLATPEAPRQRGRPAPGDTPA